MPRPWFMILALIAVLFVLASCEKKEGVPAGTSLPQESADKVVAAPKKRDARLLMPAAVEGKWQAVKIAVLDKTSNTEQFYTVDIGSSFAVADSKLTVKVLVFLPAFVMDGTTMTSASNETKNPAVQILISDEGQELFKGWLFSLYPGTHAFQHPRFNFSLVDFIPAG